MSRKSADGTRAEISARDEMSARMTFSGGGVCGRSSHAGRLEEVSQRLILSVKRVSDHGTSASRASRGHSVYLRAGSRRTSPPVFGSPLNRSRREP